MKPTLANGALVGLLITTSLVALFYVATSLLGTPFVPFDLFDWLARALPGPVITLGIDFIVSIIAAFKLGETSSAAKTAEHVMAILLLPALGAVIGAGLFALLRRTDRDNYWPGLIVGAAIGVPAAIISGTLNQTASADRLLSLAWILAAFLVWGAAFVRVYNRLAAAGDVPEPISEVVALDRRSFLVRLGGTAAAITVVGAGVGLLNRREDDVSLETAPRPWSADNPLPNADAALQPAPGTRAEFTPVRDHYRIDINSLPPVIHEEDWTLSITGLVDNPMELTLADIREKYPALDQFITLSCISNPVGGDLISTQRWTGAPLKTILADAQPHVTATQLLIKSADGFDEYVSRAMVNMDERVMLAYAWDGLPLAYEHGFPLRIFIPDRFGMKQPKWIVSIELVSSEEEGYWVRRGWDQVAQVRSTAVIDTVAADSKLQAGNQTLIQVGGMAYAGKRGISKVEIRVDDGERQEAQLRAPITDLPWVIWRYDWPFVPGEHIFTVRCTDGLGIAQIEALADTRPSGATGLQRRRETV